jgi:Ulp1 protease family, C-terminal catalytic domain
MITKLLITAVLHASSFALQDPAGWLTSQIIDVRVRQLQDQYGNHLYLNPALLRPRCPHYLDHHSDYEPVKKRWFTPARLPKDAAENLSMFDKVFFPITVGCSHWVLVVADLKVNPPTVSYLDPSKQQQHGGQYVQEVTAYLTEKVANRGAQDQSIRFEGYAETPQSATRQSNSNDCGVLMLHYMQELSMAAGSVRYAFLGVFANVVLRIPLLAVLRLIVIDTLFCGECTFGPRHCSAYCDLLGCSD